MKRAKPPAIDRCAADQQMPENVIDLNERRFRALARVRGLDAKMTVRVTR